MTRRSWTGVLALAVVLHIGLFVLDRAGEGRRTWGDESLYWNASTRVLERGDSGLELLWPPFGAWYLATIRALGGAGTAVVVVQIGLLALAAWALRGALAAAGAEHAVADGAAALLLVYPTAAAFAHYLWPEVLHLALFCLALWLLAAHRDDPRACAAMGATVGLALLTKSLLGPLVPAFLAAPALGGSRRLLRSGMAAAAFLCVVAPTVWLNVQRHDSAIIASSARFNLWVGLTDDGTREFEDRSSLEAWKRWRASGDTFSDRERSVTDEIRAIVEERGVVGTLLAQLGRQYFRLFGLSSFLTEQLPGGRIHAWGRGYRDPPPVLASAFGWAHRLVYPVVLLLVPWGLAGGLRRREPWAIAAAVLVLYTLAIFLVLHVKTRYRIQLLPALLPAAVLGGMRIVRALRRWRGAPEAERAPLALSEAAFAALGSSLLAVFVFGG